MIKTHPLTDAEFARHPIMDTQTHQDAILRSFAEKLEDRCNFLEIYTPKTNLGLINEVARLREALVWIAATAIARGPREAIANKAKEVLG